MSSQPDQTPTPEPDYAASIEFLSKWMPRGPWVLTAIVPDKPKKGAATFTDTFGQHDVGSGRLLAWLEEHGTKRQRNIYFTPNGCRKQTVKKKPTKADIAAMYVLHVDLDPSAPPEDVDKAAHNGGERQRILALLQDPPSGLPRPTCITDSGGGYQAFWRLKIPASLDGTDEAAAEAERYNRKLEELLGGDHTHNVDRVMRLPGTINRPDAKKRAKGRTEALAAVVEFCDELHDLGGFEKAEPVRSAGQGSKASGNGRAAPAPSGVERLDTLDHQPEGVSDLCKVVIAQGCDPDDDPGRFGGAPSMFGLRRGSDWTGDRSAAVWYVACELVRAGADDDTIRALLLDEGWGISAHVLDQKNPEACADRQIERARNEVGEVEAATDDASPLLDPGDPRPSARLYVEREAPHLFFHNGDWLDYGRGAYFEVESGIVSAGVFAFLERARRLWGLKQVPGPFKPMRSNVTEVLGALESVTIRARDLYAPPCWIAEPGPPPREIISCANGLLHLPTGRLLQATPSFFTRNALEIAYDPDALPPEGWLAFLGQLWPKDPDSIGVLQEVFGYLLVPDTSQQKVFLLVGPARSGKGTIGRVLTRLVGEANAVGSDMRTLGGNFGLQPLIGKQLAIVADMRLGKRSDPATIAENLLRISGEDLVTADRKNKTAWTGTLAVRFVIMTNELPRFSDASGALANRFVPLVMTESFLGREDHGLTARLLSELPGILNWAVEGWRRLRDRGHFVLPGSSRDAVQDLLDMASPVSAFVRDVCVLDPEARVEKGQLYAVWREWCLARGEPIAEEAVFSRDLYAATAGRVRAGKMPRPARLPAYVGIRQRDAAEARDDPDHDVLG
ncbi:phage/plasmid primase, P4 family [Engelhardtia mirabilis]|uniref:SF3 helicase domain-containing protein n=1 Tax=Engelhardtia mirabilis TaxID=2528011 RepID=A0A518BK37_9BACT|nr:hypothetical protein Pla133_24090 [Planctomycetes bacterium Pla133]QDV01654.1 hypothetical protein Pla86_24080 [Planctomycetes bacterium Pla86]